MNGTILVAATPDLQRSLAFYKSLNFLHIENHGVHYVVDGSAIIEVTAEVHVRSGLKLYKESWAAEVEALRGITAVAEVDNGYVLVDFSGVWIQLREEALALDLQVEISSRSMLGQFAGMSVEGISIAHMNQIWKILGFKKTMGEESGGWMTAMNDDGLTVSMMKLNACPHSFYNPSLTYFNGKQNMEVIERVRAAGIPITEEITVFNKENMVDNIIVRDPGGFGFFVFSD